MSKRKESTDPTKETKPENVKTKRRKKSKKSKKSIYDRPLHSQLLLSTTSFLNDLECAREMFNTITPILKQQDDKRIKEIDLILEKYKSIAAKKKNQKDIIISLNQLRKLIKSIVQVNRSNEMFRSNSIVLIVSRFDKFIRDVLNVYFKNQPELLKSNEKALTYNELLSLSSNVSVLNILIEKEVDRLLRNSHLDVIDYIDNKLKIGIKENFERLSNFIELTERRNLFVHTGNIVNRYYLETCKTHKVVLDPKIKEGSILGVSDKYFDDSFKCLFELGLRVGQSSVRRLFPDHINEADDNLINEIGFPIL